MVLDALLAGPRFRAFVAAEALAVLVALALLRGCSVRATDIENTQKNPPAAGMRLGDFLRGGAAQHHAALCHGTGPCWLSGLDRAVALAWSKAQWNMLRTTARFVFSLVDAYQYTRQLCARHKSILNKPRITFKKTVTLRKVLQK